MGSDLCRHLFSKHESCAADSYKCFPHLLNIYDGWLIHIYLDEENFMGI